MTITHAFVLLHDAEGMCWFTVLILAAHSARRLFASSHVKRAMDAVTGTRNRTRARFDLPGDELLYPVPPPGVVAGHAREGPL